MPSSGTTCTSALPSKKLRKIVRPSSAAANLQTHPSYQTGLWDNVLVSSLSASRPSTSTSSSDIKSRLGPRPHTQAGGSRSRPQWVPQDAGVDSQDATITKQPRRQTLGNVEGLSRLDFVRPFHRPSTSLARQFKSKIEDKISIDTLEELKKAFTTADINSSGGLDLDEFKKLLKKHLHITHTKESQIDALFMKIDWSSEGSITWDEFCTYMQLEYAEKEESALREKEVSFHLPAKLEGLPHRDPVLGLRDTSDGIFVACSLEGVVTFWSPSAELKRTRSVVNPEMSHRTKPKWITDFCLMPDFNKLIIGTGDREIQFFELSSLDPYCQISGLETVPLRIDYSSTGHDECLILYGDSQGCINILVIKSAGECLRTWKKMVVPDGFMATVTLDAAVMSDNVTFIRWQVHDDWVGQVQYYHEVGQVISCCNSSNASLVIGSTTGSTHIEQQLKEIKDTATSQDKYRQRFSYNQPKYRRDVDQTVFKVYKGVKVFDFSKTKNILATGGMDRIIRLWNPYVAGKPTAMLRGHASPIFYLVIAEEDNRIISMSTDRCIKVWDILDHACLMTLRPKSHRIRGEFMQAVHYSPVSRTLAVATDQMAMLNLKHRSGQSQDMALSHQEPVTCCKYNPAFKQIITGCNGSLVKVWDLETGAAVFEFGNAHGGEAITCMTLDNTGRRLITGGRDGILRVWNYNNGHCLSLLKRKAKHKSVAADEICDVAYIEMSKNRYIISVGWNRRINIYYDLVSDSSVSHVQHPSPYWSSDLRDGHKEDILTVAQCLPNLLATASYDGEVIVWNLVSGHIFYHLHAPTPPGYKDESLDGDLSIDKLIFLRTRAFKKEAASLVASGPRAHVHFWALFQGASLLAQFSGCHIKGAQLTCLMSNAAETLLYTSDSLGFIRVYDISNFCLSGPETEPPEVLFRWRAHVDKISNMDLVESSDVIITSSSDCTVRLWTSQGHYVGTLGQPNLWDLGEPTTFQHPMVPYDVLVDQQSLPSHPLLLERESTYDIIHQDSARGDNPDKPGSVSPAVNFSTRPSYMVDDDMIRTMLEERAFDQGTGKRLLHEKAKVVKPEGLDSHIWQKLPCYQVKEPPQPPLLPQAARAHKNQQPLEFLNLAEIDK